MSDQSYEIKGTGVVGPEIGDVKELSQDLSFWEDPDQEPLETVLEAVRRCQICAPTLPHAPRPVLRLAPSARLLIIGQAPGRRVHHSGVPWDDPSGARLRDWLQITPSLFYDPHKVALMPMGFCFPGQTAKGADLPPRPDCAQAWHRRLTAYLPNLALVLLVGRYAQKRYLPSGKAVRPKAKTAEHALPPHLSLFPQKTTLLDMPPLKDSMTETVRSFQSYSPHYIPLPHPSWRNNRWIKANPWFETDLLPSLRQSVASLDL